MFNHFSRYLKLIRAVPLHVMAQDLGIDAGLLSKYENGSRIPDLDLVIIFAPYHDVNARYELLALEALPFCSKDLDAYLIGRKTGLEHKLIRKLHIQAPLTYDPTQVVNLLRFQYRRHGTFNH